MSQWKWTSDDDLKMIKFFDSYLVTPQQEISLQQDIPQKENLKLQFISYEEFNEQFAEYKTICSLFRVDGVYGKNVTKASSFFEDISVFINKNDEKVICYYSWTDGESISLRRYLIICKHDDKIEKDIIKDFKDGMKIEDIFTKYGNKKQKELEWDVNPRNSGYVSCVIGEILRINFVLNFYFKAGDFCEELSIFQKSGIKYLFYKSWICGEMVIKPIWVKLGKYEDSDVWEDFKKEFKKGTKFDELIKFIP